MVFLRAACSRGLSHVEESRSVTQYQDRFRLELGQLDQQVRLEIFEPYSLKDSVALVASKWQQTRDWIYMSFTKPLPRRTCQATLPTLKCLFVLVQFAHI